MLGSPILDIAVGLIFIYLLLSLICSGMNELIAWSLGLRADMLEQGLKHLLDDKDLGGYAGKVYDHALVRSLGDHPSYIPGSVFAHALVDVIRSAPASVGT